MSKIHIENGVEYYDNYVISTKYISEFEGKVLTLVELLGLPKEQSEAFKSELRQKIWGGTFLKHGRMILAEEMPDFLNFYRKIDEERSQSSN